MMNITAPPTFSVPAQRTDLYHRVLEQIQAVPGVESAGIIDDLFTGNPREQALTVERDAERCSSAWCSQETRSAQICSEPSERRCSAAASFRSGIGKSCAGRDHQRGAGSAFVAGARSRGQKVQVRPTGFRRPVVHSGGRGRQYAAAGAGARSAPQMFVSLAQDPASRNVDLFIRTSSDDPLAMAGALQSAVGRAEKNAAISGMAALEQQLGTYLTQRRFQTSLLIGFSVVALLMAAVGIYGLIRSLSRRAHRKSACAWLSARRPATSSGGLSVRG